MWPWSVMCWTVLPCNFKVVFKTGIDKCYPNILPFYVYNRLVHSLRRTVLFRNNHLKKLFRHKFTVPWKPHLKTLTKHLSPSILKCKVCFTVHIILFNKPVVKIPKPFVWNSSILSAQSPPFRTFVANTWGSNKNCPSMLPYFLILTIF